MLEGFGPKSTCVGELKGEFISNEFFMELSVFKSTISSIQVMLASLFPPLDLKVSLVQHLQVCHGPVPSWLEEATYSASCWFTLPERKLGIKNSAFMVWESTSVSCKVLHNALALDNYNQKLYWKPGDFNLNCIEGQKKLHISCNMHIFKKNRITSEWGKGVSAPN